MSSWLEMPPGYDAWKLATPPEYEWPSDACEDCGRRDCPRVVDEGWYCCDACADTGWMLGPEDVAEPCSECGGPDDPDERLEP